MTHPAVSVLIPTYNCGAFVAEAIDSALSQTFRDFEIIVVDDGSTDDTPIRLAPYLDRVRHVRQENQGLARTRNRGIEMARGRFIALLDADDVWRPPFLERTVARLEADPRVGVAYTWWGYVDEASTLLPETFEKGADGDVLQPLARTCFLTPSCTVIRRDVLTAVGVYDPEMRRAEDYDLALRIAAAGYHFSLVPEVLMHYRVRSGGMSRSIGAMADGVVAALRRAAASPRYRDLGSAFMESAIRHHQLTWAGAHFRHEQWAAGCALLEPVIRHSPDALESVGFYRGLMSTMLPVGGRTDRAVDTHLQALTRRARHVLSALLDRPGMADLRPRRRRAAAALSLAAATIALRGRRIPQTFRYAARAAAASPSLLPALLARAAGRRAAAWLPGRSGTLAP